MEPTMFDDNEPDTDIHDMFTLHADEPTFAGEAPTQPIEKITMADLVGTPSDGVARSHSRDLEAPVVQRTRTRDISDGVPVYVKGERARRLTKPLGSRGAGPLILIR